MVDLLIQGPQPAGEYLGEKAETAFKRPSLHCSRCRKLGASTIVFIDRGTLQWIGGKDNVATYMPEVPFKYKRNFCAACGTSLGEILSEEDSFPIPANCFDSDPIVRNTFHEFVDSKPNWYEICDDQKQFIHHPK